MSPFAITDSARVPGDPRQSLATRYNDKENYVRRITMIARDLVRERLLLQEDADVFVATARRVPEF